VRLRQKFDKLINSVKQLILAVCSIAFLIILFSLPVPAVAATPTPTVSADSPCKFVTNTQQNSDCINCTGVWTAIGCVPIDKNNPNGLISLILTLGLGLAGGIAFLLILFGGLQIMTSAGNPEQLNAGRELVTSAVIGLILILFSIFLLQFIGINIIGIPGFIAK